MQGENWIQFVVPTRIHFESDSAFKIGGWVKEFGSRALLLNIRKENKNPEELQILKNGLIKNLDGCILYDDLIGDPDSEQIDSATYFAKKANADVIVAMGGLDTINAAKAIALLATNSIFASDLLNEKAKPREKALPLIIVPVEPTLGEEIVPSFTIVDAETGVRKYYTNNSLHPAAVCYDPKICSHLTSDNAASMGGALMVYAVESILGPSPNPITNTLILKAVDTIRKNLPEFYQNPKDEKLITSMLWASAMTGISLITNPLGVSWALGTALTAATGIDYYYALTTVLPHVMEYYLTATPSQFVSIAKSLDQDVKEISVIEAAIKAVEGVRKLFIDVNLPTRLSDFNMKKAQLSEIAAAAITYPHIRNAPRQLNKNEIESILLSAF